MAQDRLKDRDGERLNAHKRRLTSVQRFLAVKENLADKRVYRPADDKIHPDAVVLAIPQSLQHAKGRWIDAIEVLELVDEHGHRLRSGSLEHLAEETAKRANLTGDGIGQDAVELLDEVRNKVSLALARHEQIHEIPISQRSLDQFRLADAPPSGDDGELRLR